MAKINSGDVFGEHTVLGPTGKRNNANSRLTKQDVSRMRELYETKQLNQREIGEQFGVAHQTVSKIVRKDRWVNG